MVNQTKKYALVSDRDRTYCLLVPKGLTQDPMQMYDKPPQLNMMRFSNRKNEKQFCWMEFKLLMNIAGVGTSIWKRAECDDFFSLFLLKDSLTRTFGRV